VWFADIGLGVAWTGVACWLVVTAIAMMGPRLGLAVPAVLGGAGQVSLLVGTGAAVALFTAQAALVDTIADLPVPGVLDQSVLSWFVTHRAAPVTVVMTAISDVGGTAGMTVLAAIAVLVLWIARRRVEATTVAVAAIGAGVLVTGFKNLYDRGRPPLVDRLVVETNASLPSGHALGSVVVLGVLATVVVLGTRRSAVQVGAVAPAAVGTAAIGISRLYLGVHWITDVLTGWLLGGAWLAVCVTVLMMHTAARRHPDPVLRKATGSAQ